MRLLLVLCRGIDGLNRFVGRTVMWMILLAALVSAANAVVRHLFSTSSNAWLELQWYLFGAVFLLCAGYTLLNNEHIRIDIVTSRFSKRTRTWIDILGGLFFLLPMAVLIGYLAWPMFMDSLLRWEMSSDAGGLVRWPAKILVPAGFALLALQGVSEIVKRIAFLMGAGPDPAPDKTGPSAVDLFTPHNEPPVKGA